jgi:dTDP-4-dehydrorhamnose reductase
MIFLIGRNGYVAGRFAAELERRGVDFAVTSSHPQGDDLRLDLRDTGVFDYSQVGEGDAVVLLAAESSPDVCANEYDKAYSINVSGAAEFIKGTLNRGAKVLFFSSDVVYGHREEPVNESDSTEPIGVYAEMKCRVEEQFVGTKNFKVFRPSLVFSKESIFAANLMDCVRDGKAIKAFPMKRAVVYVDDIVEAALNLFERWEEFDSWGINLCGPELLSRAKLAGFYKYLIDDRLEIQESEAPDGFFLKRPRTINMQSLYLEGLLGRKATSISEAMKIEFAGG